MNLFILSLIQKEIAQYMMDKLTIINNRTNYFEVSDQITHDLISNSIIKADFFKILAGEFVAYQEDEKKFDEMIKFLNDNKVLLIIIIECESRPI